MYHITSKWLIRIPFFLHFYFLSHKHVCPTGLNPEYRKRNIRRKCWQKRIRLNPYPYGLNPLLKSKPPTTRSFNRRKFSEKVFFRLFSSMISSVEFVNSYFHRSWGPQSKNRWYFKGQFGRGSFVATIRSLCCIRHVQNTQLNKHLVHYSMQYAIWFTVIFH